MVDWEADLNGDGATDLELSLMGSTGSKGESIRAVYVNCGAGAYAVVWGPAYVYALELADAPPTPLVPSAWHDLTKVERVEQGDREQHDRIAKVTLRFASGRYAVVP